MNAMRKDFDGALAILEAVRPTPEYTYTLGQIAYACDISRARVLQIQQEALRKLRRGAMAHGLRGELSA